MNNNDPPVLTNFFLIPAKQLASDIHNAKQEESHVKSDNNKHITSFDEINDKRDNDNMYIQSIDALIWESNNNKGDAQHV